MSQTSQCIHIAGMPVHLAMPEEILPLLEPSLGGFFSTAAVASGELCIDVVPSASVERVDDGAFPQIDDVGGALRLSHGALFTLTLDPQTPRAELRYQRQPYDGRMGQAPGGIRGALKALHALRLPERGGLLLHASGVDVDGAGVAFIGKSGAGKTTTCLHFGQEHILNDELIAITDIATSPRVHATPFSGRLTQPRHNRSVPLRLACKIVQAPTITFEELNAAGRFRQLCECIALPFGSPEREARAFSLAAQLCGTTSWRRFCLTREGPAVVRAVRQELGAP